MKVLLFAPYFSPASRGGGPIRTLSALTRTAPPTVDLAIITRDRDLGESEPLPVERNAWVPVASRSARIRYTSFGRPADVVRALWSTRGHQDVVYLNSFFDRQLSFLPVVLHRLNTWRGARLLIAPRGEFSPGALALKEGRKRLYIRVFKVLASRRLIWHASTAEEVLDIREAVGGGARVVVREDDHDLPAVAMPRPARPKGSDEVLRVVFVSRLSPKKGLAVLLDAVAAVSAPLVLDIYGPEEDPGVVTATERAIELMPDHVTCSLKGPVGADEVRGVFAQYDVFAFPTAGENFGHVIAEALSAGCPVLLSDTTPWSDVIRQGGGILVSSRRPDEWAHVLDDLARATPEQWEAASLAASAAYAEWASAPQGPHVFDLLTDV